MLEYRPISGVILQTTLPIETTFDGGFGIKYAGYIGPFLKWSIWKNVLSLETTYRGMFQNLVFFLSRFFQHYHA